MRVQLYTKDAEHHKEWIGAFATGLQMHNVSYGVSNHTEFHPANLHVFWSMKHPHIIEQCHKDNEYNHGSNVPFICLERGYIDRHKFTSVNLNGLNGRSKLRVSYFKDNDYRREKYDWHVRERKEHGREIIIIGQMPGDSSLEGIDVYTWARETYDWYEKKGYAPMFKPHPLEPPMVQNIEPLTFQGMNLYPYKSIHRALNDARLIHTYSSNAAVDAWLAGVPCYADSPISMISNWVSPEGTCLGLKQWLNELSYKQYNKKEFESGEVWQLLKDSIVGA